MRVFGAGNRVEASSPKSAVSASSLTERKRRRRSRHRAETRHFLRRPFLRRRDERAEERVGRGASRFAASLSLFREKRKRKRETR